MTLLCHVSILPIESEDPQHPLDFAYTLFLLPPDPHHERKLLAFVPHALDVPVSHTPLFIASQS